MAVEKIAFFPLHEGIEERRVSGKSLADALGLQDLGVLSREAEPPAGALIVVQADAFSAADAAAVERLRRQTSAPIVVHFQSLAGVEPSWFPAQSIGVVPRDLSNGLTVAECIRCSLNSPFLPSRMNGVVVTGDDEFARFMRELSADIDAPGSRVVIGVLALPRSGSKALADMLTLWASPRAAVFHGHGLSMSRRAEFVTQAEKAERAGDPEKFRSARVKMAFFEEMHRKIGNASRLVLFLAERDPIQRLYSHFGMTRGAILQQVVAGSAEPEAAQAKLDGFAKSAIAELATWYDAEYGAFGFTPADVAIRGRDFAVARSDRAALVALRTETREPLLRSIGLWSDLASSNSASDRGYGAARATLGRQFAIGPQMIERLYSNPWIAAMHEPPA